MRTELSHLKKRKETNNIERERESMKFVNKVSFK